MVVEFSEWLISKDIVKWSSVSLVQSNLWSSPRISTWSLRTWLFVLYIIDVSETIRCKLGIFTDDTKFYSIINSVRDVECNLDSMQE